MSLYQIRETMEGKGLERVGCRRKPQNAPSPASFRDRCLVSLDPSSSPGLFCFLLFFGSPQVAAVIFEATPAIQWAKELLCCTAGNRHEEFITKQRLCSLRVPARNP